VPGRLEVHDVKTDQDDRVGDYTAQSGTFQEILHLTGLGFDEEAKGKASTTLRWTHATDGEEFAVTTYELSHGGDGKITVDRGFVSAEKIGEMLLIKTLKIVAFADESVNDALIKKVDPAWSQIIEYMVAEHGGGTGPAKTVDAQSDLSTAAIGMLRPLRDDWVRAVTESASGFADAALDTAARAAEGKYESSDLGQDTMKAFWNLAQGWANMWQVGSKLVNTISPPSHKPNWSISGPLSGTTEWTVVCLPQPNQPTLPITVSALAPLVKGQLDRTIPSTAIRPTPVVGSFGPRGQSRGGVRIDVDTAKYPVGMYVGEVTVPDAEPTRALFYVSHAMDA
jgi:hypothetical protein